MCQTRVSDIMASYEAQVRTVASQGKPVTSHQSGRYNTVDAIISEPEKQWPNKGFHGGQGKGSHSGSSGFAPGNIPWEAVCNAYASSMHNVKEGILIWDNTTQWSLNRLSASQIAMSSQGTINQPTNGS